MYDELAQLKQQLEEERCRRKLAEDALLRSNAALDAVYGSTRYRLGSRIADIADKLKPRKPVSPTTDEDLSLPWFFHGCSPTPAVPSTLPIPQKGLSKDDYAMLSVPQWDNPTVSIIIPVYNQFEYTYRCVESILRNSGTITYEILIADDCSTDLTVEITSILNGVRHIRNEKNLRFLLNCNHAAQYAKGKYVLFLNNDTQVMPNWLEPLVRLIESADDIGMVGSKLIYPDGRLQEAGGIVWQDGTAWNYGNKGDPAMPEFNYVKEADYISGAAIMLPRALWEEIGGFDDSFCPSYCEDSDLAFTVRSLGYRVLYQPESVVVHFEGVSNGTSTSSGLKQYQITNTQKLRDKWAQALTSHPKGGTCVFPARDRSLGKYTVVILSDTAEQGFSLAMEEAAKGHHVKLMPMDFDDSAPCVRTMQQHGIEVLYGELYKEHHLTWLVDHGQFFDCVCITFGELSEKYAALIRDKSSAVILMEARK